MAKGASEGPTVLIVDEEALLRLSLSDALRECGFSPLEASSADEAIAIIQSGSKVDVVLTDVKMPGSRDGFGLAKWLRENCPGIPVFIASGYSGKFDIAQELCAGEEFFAKPYDLKVIVRRLKAAVLVKRD